MKRILSDELTITELLTAIKETTDVAEQLRIKVIIKVKEGKTGNKIKEELMVSIRSINTWVQRYRQNGLNGLKTKRSGRREGNPKWDKQIFNELVKEIDSTEQYWSVPLMNQWIKENYKQDIPDTTILYHLNKLGYSYTSARPHPYKGDPLAQQEFKKKVSKRWLKN